MPRLFRRCRSAARSLGAHVSAEDLAQAALVEALENIAGVWFDTPPTKTLEAQMWSLLKDCIRHQVTKHHRAAKRRGVLTAPEGSEADPFETEIADRGASPEEVARIREAMARLHEAANPRRRLMLYMLNVPHFVTRGHIEAATEAGGLARGASATWTGYLELLGCVDLRRKSADWKLALVELLYFSAPLGVTDPTEIKKRANALEASVSRAKRSMSAAVRDAAGDCP